MWDVHFNDLINTNRLEIMSTIMETKYSRTLMKIRLSREIRLLHQNKRVKFIRL